jgi:hypothetical protein
MNQEDRSLPDSILKELQKAEEARIIQSNKIANDKFPKS